MKITRFDKNVCDRLSHEAIAELRDWATKNGIEVSDSGGTFGANQFTMRLLLSIGSQKEAEEREYGKNWNNSLVAGSYNLQLGQQFTSKGKLYTIIGYKFGGKFNLVTRGANGTLTYFRIGLVDQASKSVPKGKTFNF